MHKHRLDQELVDQGYFCTTADAMRAVMAGDVSTINRRLERAGEQVPVGLELHVRNRIPYVSRGGLKLEAGLKEFGIRPEGLRCLDVGCSTGGFTDCLLRHGAASVIAVDVGYAQFDWSLRQDDRVTLLERTNIVDVPAICTGGTIDLAVCDVSFTSVLRVSPAVALMLAPGGRFLTLVKPQFEAERSDVGSGGVVRDESVRQRALEHVVHGLQEQGFRVCGTCDSPVTGRKGNHEFLLLAIAPAE